VIGAVATTEADEGATDQAIRLHLKQLGMPADIAGIPAFPGSMARSRTTARPLVTPVG